MKLLILGDGSHRLSIDIDIMCPPGTNIEDYLKDYAQSGFLEYQLVNSPPLPLIRQAYLTIRRTNYPRWKSSNNSTTLVVIGMFNHVLKAYLDS